MSRATAVHWDPFDAQIAQDPYPYYRRLREEAPLYYNAEHDFWTVSRYEDVDRTLMDWETFSSARGPILEVIKANIEIPPGTLLMEDPPAHDIHRSLLARVFTPKRVKSLEPQIRDFCRGSLELLADEKRFDLMAAFANEVPMRVIGMLLGIPEADQVGVRDLSNVSTRPGEQMQVTDTDAMFHPSRFAEYIEWREDHPSDDLMTELLNAEFTDPQGVHRRLRREEILTYVAVLAGAGAETTARLIGWLTYELGNHPDQRAELVADHSLIPNAIEETLRYQPIGHSIARYVTRDVEIRGTTVPEGSAITIIVASANRDDDVWDEPDRYDIHRDTKRHRTFGLGAHYCMGNALARLEGRIALEEMLTHFPEWEVDKGDIALSSTTTVRGWERLPITVN